MRLNTNFTIKNIITVLLISLFAFSLLLANSDLEKGIKLLEEKKIDEAQKIFLSLSKTEKKNAKLNYYMGYIYLIKKDHDKSIDYLEKAIDLDDRNADYHLMMAQALGMKIQKSSIFKQAWLAPKVLKAFKKTVECDSTKIGGHMGLFSYYLQAPSIAGGDVKKAKHEAQIIYGLSEYQGLICNAQIYKKEGKLDSAKMQYEKIEQNYEKYDVHFSFYNSYGYFLLSLKNYEEAVEKLKKQVELAPKNSNAHDSLGDGYRAWGKLQEAADEYRIAYEMDNSLKHSKKKYEEIMKKIKK